MMITVQVLLSSYNGEKYIREQLDSILAQEGVDIQLLIRDDGSTDGTKSILAEYEQQWENISVIYGMNVGVIQSFFLLLEQAGNYPYVALADQDDVWLKQKLKRAIVLIEKKEINQKNSNYQNGLNRQDSKFTMDYCEKQKGYKHPIVYCSAKQLVDVTLNPLPSPMKYSNVRTEFGNALVENMCTGCTCVINQAMLQLLKGKQPKFTVMHDFWIYLVGTCFGTVIYDEESYILYRQHGENELGAATSLFENYKRRIKNFKKYRGQLTKQAEEFLCLYKNEILEDKKCLGQDLILAKENIGICWKILKERKIFRQNKMDNIILKVLILFHLI